MINIEVRQENQSGKGFIWIYDYEQKEKTGKGLKSLIKQRNTRIIANGLFEERETGYKKDTEVIEEIDLDSWTNK